MGVELEFVVYTNSSLSNAAKQANKKVGWRFCIQMAQAGTQAYYRRGGAKACFGD